MEGFFLPCVQRGGLNSGDGEGEGFVAEGEWGLARLRPLGYAEAGKRKLPSAPCGLRRDKPALRGRKSAWWIFCNFKMAF